MNMGVYILPISGMTGWMMRYLWPIEINRATYKGLHIFYFLFKFFKVNFISLFGLLHPCHVLQFSSILTILGGVSLLTYALK